MNTKKVLGCYGTQNLFCAIAVIIALAFITCDDGKDSHTHDAGIWVITQQSTCTGNGIKELQCTVDHFVLDTQTIPALGHDWNTETGLCDNNCGELYYSIGDTGPGGGKIFYRTATGFPMTDDNSTAHYLEAAPADMTTTLAWASTGYTSTDIEGTATEIGTGRKNTALILATDTNAPAAKACDNYNNDDKTDWFLPSKDELNQLWVNRASVGNLKTTQDNVNYIHYYWSSSQIDSNHTWDQRFSDGGQFGNGDGKNDTFSVRAVRAF